jgi:hypothetical protein
MCESVCVCDGPVRCESLRQELGFLGQDSWHEGWGHDSMGHVCGSGREGEARVGVGWQAGKGLSSSVPYGGYGTAGGKGRRVASCRPKGVAVRRRGTVMTGNGVIGRQRVSVMAVV